MGDDTWMQLFPSSFHSATPLPSLHVNDLHTVDDGVWRALRAAVGNRSSDGVVPAGGCGCASGGSGAGSAACRATGSGSSSGSGDGGSSKSYSVDSSGNSSGGSAGGGASSTEGKWHLFVGHYLGVDHAGHTHGVRSAEMDAKLAQLDGHMAHLVGAFVVHAASCVSQFLKPGVVVDACHAIILSPLSGRQGGAAGWARGARSRCVLLACFATAQRGFVFLVAAGREAGAAGRARGRGRRCATVPSMEYLKCLVQPGLCYPV